MKHLIIIIALTLATVSYGQEKLITRTGKATFYSETAIENISAENNQVASILLIDQKTMAFNVLLKSFKFEKALMEEHFNEKYVESDKYPSAKYKGMIHGPIDLKKPGTYKDVSVQGNMHFHGVIIPLNIRGTFKINDDHSITFSSNFNLNLEQYKIEIPSLVKDKINENIKVSIETNYM